ncbi:MAG: GNAT family N-acetyltransferase [Desulfatiglandales bacterium]
MPDGSGAVDNRMEKGAERTGSAGLGLNERLGLIGLIDEGARSGVEGSPVVADLFSDLWHLVDRTIKGARVSPLRPEKSHNGFGVLEINAETGENLGRLNMLYLRKPIPCYYLVYVEVSPPFRSKGLGRLVLEYFRQFLEEKTALGILDNIISPEDPAYDIYTKQAWEPLDAILGDAAPQGTENFMVFVPLRFRDRDLKEPVLRVIHHLSRKRAAIDMRDNEEMVKHTLAEFRDLYDALLGYFHRELDDGRITPLMRFMFTRYVTKLIGFRRRIAGLLGYTGGDSLEQIVLDPNVLSLKTKSYAPSELASKPALVFGERSLWLRLPEELKRNPARTIEAMPNYARPALASWLDARGAAPGDFLTIGDFLDMGFDPTRLKELTLEGVPYIFERVQARQLDRILREKVLLERLGPQAADVRARNARLLVNPPVLAVRDRGNGYVLRRKVEGVHWEEAVEQLQTASSLRAVNASLHSDRLIQATVRQAFEAAEARVEQGEHELLDNLACFIPWDLETNRPRMVVEFHGTYLESVWLA